MSDICRDIPSKVTAFVNLLKSYPIPTDLDITVLDGNNYGSNNDAFVKVDQHFGIDAAQLPTLACQFRSYYTNLRKNPLRLTEGGFNKDTCQFNKDMMDATKSLLCVCPDNSTAWGDRSRSILFRIAAYDNKSVAASCLEDDMTDAVSLLQEELQFLNFLFTRHSSKLRMSRLTSAPPQAADIIYMFYLWNFIGKIIYLLAPLLILSSYFSGLLHGAIASGYANNTCNTFINGPDHYLSF
jgi:hypothetical protein